MHELAQKNSAKTHNKIKVPQLIPFNLFSTGNGAVGYEAQLTVNNIIGFRGWRSTNVVFRALKRLISTLRILRVYEPRKCTVYQ